MATGARVSNAYTTYHMAGDSPGKLGLNPHSALKEHFFKAKRLGLVMGVRPIS